MDFVKSVLIMHQSVHTLDLRCSSKSTVSFSFSDIFSYYKETKAEDKATYIVRLSIANQRSEIKELEDLIARVTTAFQRIRRILGEGKRETHGRVLWLGISGSIFKSRDIGWERYFRK